MQSFGSDPFGGSSWVGLRVPTLATELLAAPGQSAQDSRYLMMLAAFSLSEGVKARVLGYRQMVRIGYTAPRNGDLSTSTPRTVTQEVEDPAWHFADGNVSFHIADLWSAEITRATRRMIGRRLICAVSSRDFR